MPDFQSDLRPQGISFCPRRKETTWFFNIAITDGGWLQWDSVAGPCWSFPRSGQLMKVSSPAATTRPPPRSEGTISEQSKSVFQSETVSVAGKMSFSRLVMGSFLGLTFFSQIVCIPNRVYYIVLLHFQPVWPSEWWLKRVAALFRIGRNSRPSHNQREAGRSCNQGLLKGISDRF